MTVALFVPCYMDQLRPSAARAALEVLERLGCTVTVPEKPACCGQPMANAGFASQGEPLLEQFATEYEPYDHVVVPSGSCALHLREHGPALAQRVYEWTAFLVDVLGVDDVAAAFPHHVGLHEGCHGLRGLGLGHPSEISGSGESPARRLLGKVKGLNVVDLNRSDECCGFGGTFSIGEPAVSVRMGEDRIYDHVTNGAEVIASGDLSCLLHLEGVARRQGESVRVMHVAEILNTRES